MAEPQQQVDFEPVTAAEILPERREGWDRFTQAATWAIGAVAVLLVLLKVFLA